jgi:hypothetical protein
MVSNLESKFGPVSQSSSNATASKFGIQIRPFYESFRIRERIRKIWEAFLDI